MLFDVNGLTHSGNANTLRSGLRRLRAPLRRLRVAANADYLILLVWSLFLFAYGISTGTLYRTEALRAIIGREALNGSWFVPTAQGEPVLTKPPGMYIAIALASLPFGEVTTVSARIPSAIAATITVFLFYFAFRRILDRRLALMGAMLMPMSWLWLEKAPSAEIDMLQVMWVSAALLMFFRTVEGSGFGVRSASKGEILPLLALRAPTKDSSLTLRVSMTAPLILVALGFLTKWTAPAFFYLTIIPYLMWRRQLNLLWSKQHLIALGIAACIVACWALAVVNQVGWPLLRDTVLAEAAQRFAPNHQGRAYPWLESIAFPFQVMLADFPWSILAIYALRPSFMRQLDEPSRRFVQLLHCWTWPNLIFWSLPAQHHVRYVLPMCPGMVGLGVMVLLAATRRLCAAERVARAEIDARAPLRKASASRLTKICAAILVIYACIKIVYVEGILPPRTAHRQVRETAERLNQLVPPGETLYVDLLKDDGILFYYARPAQRFRAAQSIPISGSNALLIEREWECDAASGIVEEIERLRDQQGAPIFLVRYR